MTYYFIGEGSIINDEIEKIRNDKNISFNSVIKYSALDIDINNVLYELKAVNLFSEDKIVVLYDIDKLIKDEDLIKYIEHSNSNNILILVSQSEIDNRKKLYKMLKQKSKIINFNEFNIEEYIRNNFNDYKISNKTINILIDYCNSDYERIKNEIEKLKMYKANEKEINDEDIEALVVKSLNTNIFNLIDALNRKNKKNAIEIARELTSHSEDDIKILITLANNYRLIYRVKILKSSVDDKKMMELLNIKNPYRLKKLKEQSNYYTEDDLLNTLKLLSDLDIKIKSGKLDKGMALELFLAKV